MPHDAHLRPQWMIRMGLFLYDNLAKRDHLAASASLDLRKHPAGTALESRYTRGFIYSDGWTDDARLVALNARDAADRGAVVLTRTRCEKIEPITTSSRPAWRATLKGTHERVITTRAVVNATGPWVTNFLSHATPAKTRTRCATREGQPHRRATPLPPPVRVHFPEHRPTPRLRDSL